MSNEAEAVRSLHAVLAKLPPFERGCALAVSVIDSDPRPIEQVAGLVLMAEAMAKHFGERERLELAALLVNAGCKLMLRWH
jgi:hypothetical protein